MEDKGAVSDKAGMIQNTNTNGMIYTETQRGVRVRTEGEEGLRRHGNRQDGVKEGEVGREGDHP